MKAEHHGDDIGIKPATSMMWCHLSKTTSMIWPGRAVNPRECRRSQEAPVERAGRRTGIFDHFILFEVRKHKPEGMKYKEDKSNTLILRLEKAASVC